MKFIIAGYGFVGKAVKAALKYTYETEVVDPALTEVKISDHYDAAGIIICVNTPSDDNGDCDISNVLDVISQTPVHMPILIKSTVSPDKLKAITEKYSEHSIAYSPEFLRAKSAIEDFAKQKYMIIGGDDPLDFWHCAFRGAMPNLLVVHKCSIEEAAIIKYATNSFLAMKVSFFNHIYDICEASGHDFDIVRHLICQDNRIGTSHSMVPGPDGERGWGGHCFPKDTSAFIHYINSLDQKFDLLETVIEYNKKVKKGVDTSVNIS
jgi:UDPglucose 6-dehydrogenase